MERVMDQASGWLAIRWILPQQWVRRLMPVSSTARLTK
jgi:hypothetical protein